MKSVPTHIYTKQYVHKHQTQNFRRISPFGIAPLKKKHIRLGQAGIVDHCVDLSVPDLKKKSIKNSNNNNNKRKKRRNRQNQ